MPGKNYSFGDVVLAQIQFADTHEVKKRPALVLFEQYDNIVVAGITSNTQMDGVPLTKQEGALKDSTIKLNYIFTVSEHMVEKKLFRIGEKKKTAVRKGLLHLLG